MPPGEALCDKLSALEGLHQLDDLQVGDAWNLWVLWQVEVLLGEQDSLCGGNQRVSYLHIRPLASYQQRPCCPAARTLEEVLVDLTTILLCDQHAGQASPGPRCPCIVSPLTSARGTCTITRIRLRSKGTKAPSRPVTNILGPYLCALD